MVSTHGGDDQSHAGSVGQAKAQVHRIPRPSSPHHLVSQLSQGISPLSCARPGKSSGVGKKVHDVCAAALGSITRSL